MQLRTQVAVVAPLLLALGAAAYAFRPTEEKQALPVAAATDVDALKDELRRYRDELKNVRSLVQQSRAQAVRSFGQAPADDDEPMRDESVADESSGSRAEHKDHIADMEATFSAEGHDASWQPERELTQKLAGILPRGSAMQEIECRTSMCRLVTSHADTSSYRSFTEAFSALGALPSPSSSPPVWDGWVGFEAPEEPARKGEGVVARVFLGRPVPPRFE